MDGLTGACGSVIGRAAHRPHDDTKGVAHDVTLIRSWMPDRGQTSGPGLYPNRPRREQIDPLRQENALSATDPPLVRLQDTYDALEAAIEAGNTTRASDLRAKLRSDLSYQAQLDFTAQALARNGITTHVREQFRALGWNLIRFTT